MRITSCQATPEFWWRWIRRRSSPATWWDVRRKGWSSELMSKGCRSSNGVSVPEKERGIPPRKKYISMSEIFISYHDILMSLKPGWSPKHLFDPQCSSSPNDMLIQHSVPAQLFSFTELDCATKWNSFLIFLKFWSWIYHVSLMIPCSFWAWTPHSFASNYQEVYIQVLYRQVQTARSWLTKWISELQNEVRA